MTTNLQFAATVATHVQLLGVALRTANLVSDVDPFEMIPEVAFNVKHRARYVRSESDPERLEVFLDFVFRALDERDSESPKELANLRATFVLQYAVPGDLAFEPEALRQFAWLNGAYNAWPYWRELVQSVAGRIGLGALTVPVFRPKIEQIPSADSEGEAESDEATSV